MLKHYQKPHLQTYYLATVEHLMEISNSAPGPSADYMSNPGVAGAKSNVTHSSTVWDDDWSKQ